MTHLKDPIQKSVVDGRGSADNSVSEEEGSEGGEDGVCCSNSAVDCQVKPNIQTCVAGEEGLPRGRGRSGWVRVRERNPSNKEKQTYIKSKTSK